MITIISIHEFSKMSIVFLKFFEKFFTRRGATDAQGRAGAREGVVTVRRRSANIGRRRAGECSVARVQAKPWGARGRLGGSLVWRLGGRRARGRGGKSAVARARRGGDGHAGARVARVRVCPTGAVVFGERRGWADMAWV